MRAFAIYLSIYTLATIAGIGFSFGLKSRPARIAIRIISLIFAVPLILGIVGTGLLAILAWVMQPPSLDSLQKHFPERQHDLETLAQMSNQDTKYPRIAPDFLDREYPAGKYTQLFAADGQLGFTAARWNAYRSVFTRNQIKLGIDRNDAGDIFIMSDSIGLLNRGHTTGYVLCALPKGPVVGQDRFHPCESNQNQGSQEYKAEPRQDAYSFRRLDGEWFVYDEGPS